MTREAPAATAEVINALDTLEKQGNRISFKLDLSRVHRITSGDIIAIAGFMAKNPGIQELFFKAQFHQIEYINKTLQILSRQSLRRLLLTINTNKTSSVLCFNRQMIESFCSNFKAKIFPKLNTFGLYRAAFSSPELIPLYISNVSGVGFTSLHLSLLDGICPPIPLDVARTIGTVLRHQKSLLKIALLNIKMGQREAEGFLESLEKQSSSRASEIVHLYLGMISPGVSSGTQGIQGVIIDPTSLAASFLVGIERKLKGVEAHKVLESGISVLITAQGFQKMVIGCYDELKRQLGEILISLCYLSLTEKKPRSHHAIKSLIADVVNDLSIRFEADESLRGEMESLTRKVGRTIEEIKEGIEEELVKGLDADFNNDNNNRNNRNINGHGKILSGTDSYGNSEGYGSRSKSGTTQGGSHRSGKRGNGGGGWGTTGDKDDLIFGSFCSSSPISDDIDEDFEEESSYTNSNSDGLAIASARTGVGGRPVFSSTGTLWEYNPSSLIIDNIISYVAHCDQNNIIFEKPSGMLSDAPLKKNEDSFSFKRAEILEDLISGEDKELDEKDQILLLGAIHPNIIELYKEKASMFTARCFSSLQKMVKQLSVFPRTEIGSILPPSLACRGNLMYVWLVN